MVSVQVHKFGGACTGSKRALKQICKHIVASEKPCIIAVSAAAGVTDFLKKTVTTVLMHKVAIPEVIKTLKHRHFELLPDNSTKETINALNTQFSQLERLLFGISYTEELTARTQDLILTFGERLISVIIKEHLRQQNIDVDIVDPTKLIVTDGVHGDAMAQLEKTENKTQKTLKPLLQGEKVIIVPGFYGISEKNHAVTVLGRSGTDYTATVLGYALEAKKIIIWKDVKGFMSADPRIVPHAHNIPQLSYEEAAELAHFGAKILHPLAVLPAQLKRIPIEIRHFYQPNISTIIRTNNENKENNVIKSVSYLKDLAVLKIYAAMGGHTRGLLAKLAISMENAEINVLSIATSQTCIAFLMKKEMVQRAVNSIKELHPRLIDSWQVEDDFALICVVGDGLGKIPGIASRVFNAVARVHVNVELISAGASHSAYHFTVKNTKLPQALRAVHDEFFSQRN